MSSSDDQPPPLSSAEIIQLAYECRRRSQNNIDQPAIPPFLLTPSSHATLLCYLHDRAASSPNPSTAVSEYVASLLSLSKIVDSLTSLLPSLLLSYTSLFISHQIPHDSHSSSSLRLFSTHLDSMPAPDLVPIVDSIISYLPRISENEDIQILIVLPKCVNLIRSLDGVKNKVEYTNSVLDKMLECGWCKVLCLKMVEIIQDFKFLDKTRRSEFLAKVFGGMRDVDVQDMPWLVDQLLILASKGFGKREVIEGIVMFFGGEEMDMKDEPILRQAGGTVLPIIKFAVEEDPELEKEVLGLVKLGYSRAFNHFSVEVLWSIASVKSLNVSAIRVLKSTLLGAYTEYKFAKECKWLADGLKEDYFQHARAMEKAVLRAVKESSFGREHVVPSIVQLGFGLLEGVEKKNSKETKYDCVAGPEELGSEMLKSLFDLNDVARNEIIQQCKLQILSSKPNVMQIIRLFGHLVQSHPNPLLKRTSHLEELLDYFTFLGPEDNTILVLRKAAISRESSVRISAAAAIVELLLAEKRSEKTVSLSLQKRSSQAYYSQKTEVYRTAEADLFQKLSGLLERCLRQQPRVREIVYHGLLKLVLIDPLSAAHVLNFLLPHFQRILTKDAELLLKIIDCIKIESDEFFIEEPFDCLLYCISWILQLFHQHATDPSVSSDLPGFSLIQENEAGRNPASHILSNGLLEMRDLIKSESLLGILEDSEAEHTLASGHVLMFNILFLGFIEVNLNSIFFELDKATDVKKVELVKELSYLICLYDCTEENTSKDMQKRATKRRHKRSSGNFGSDKLYSSCTNLQERSPRLKTSSIHKLLLSAMKKFGRDFKDESAEHSNLFDLLSDNSPVLPVTLSFILKICMRQLDFIASLGKDDPLKTEQGNIYSLGLPLLIVILSLKSGKKSETGQREKDIKGGKNIGGHRKNIHLALVCLKKLIALSVCSLDCADLLNDLLSVARDEIASGNVSDTSWDHHGDIHNIVDPGRSKEMFIEKIIKPLLQEFLGLSNHFYFQEAEVICDILMMIASTMVGEKKNLIGEWATSVCQSTYIRNPEVAKRLVSLVVSLTSAPNDLLVVQDMATQLLLVVGSEKAAPLDKSKAYTVINKPTSAAVATSILQFIKSITCDMDSIIRKLQACIAAQNENPKVLALEESLYARAEATALVLSSFVQMNLKGPQTEQFMRTTANFFKCSAQILKFLIAPRVGKQILQNLKYQKLEQTTGRLLTPLTHFVAPKPKEQKVELDELQNQLDGTETEGVLVHIASKLAREAECNLELITQMQDYHTSLAVVRNALLREKEHYQGSGGEEGKGNDKNSSPESNSAEAAAAAEDPGSPDRVGIDIQAKKKVKADAVVEGDPDGPSPSPG